MPDMGYADKYNSVGWKATVPESADLVDAIGNIGDMVIEFRYDDTTDPLNPRLINKKGGIKKPSQVWAGIPDGGAWGTSIPFRGANSYRNAILASYTVSGTTYYLELFQAGYTHSYSETVAQAISTGMINDGGTARITESLSPSESATHIPYSQAQNTTWTNYNFIINSGMQISTATKSDISYDFGSSTYTYSPNLGTSVVLYSNQFIAAWDAGVRNLVKLYPYFRAANPEIGNESGSLVKSQLGIKASINLLDSASYLVPVNIYDYNTSWNTVRLLKFDFGSVEFGVYVGATFTKIYDYFRYSGNGTWVTSTETTTNFFNFSASSYEWLQYYCGNNILLRQRPMDVYLRGWTDYIHSLSYSWNGSQWVASRVATYIVEKTRFSARDATTENTYWESSIRLSDGIEVFAASYPYLSTLPYPHPINYGTWRYIPHYGQAYFSGASVLLYKEWDPDSIISFSHDDTTIYSKGVYIEYINPDTSEMNYRVSIPGNKSIMYFDFGNSMANTPTFDYVPYMTTYSDGTVATMSRVWNCFSDISGWGAFAYDLVKKGATILKIY